MSTGAAPELTPRGYSWLRTSSSGIPEPMFQGTFTFGISSSFFEVHPSQREAPEAVPSTAEQVLELRDSSGLTIDQIGRLFGVSRRSVHNWINGKVLNPRHEERLAQILEVLRNLPSDTPAGRRAVLLDAREGRSIFHQLLADVNEDATIQVRALSVRDRLQL